jgi:hypothetical protein
MNPWDAMKGQHFGLVPTPCRLHRSKPLSRRDWLTNISGRAEKCSRSQKAGNLTGGGRDRRRGYRLCGGERQPCASSPSKPWGQACGPSNAQCRLRLHRLGGLRALVCSRRRPQHIQRPAPSHISHLAARSAFSETKRSRRGEPPSRPEPELGLRIFTLTNSVCVTRPLKQVNRQGRGAVDRPLAPAARLSQGIVTFAQCRHFFWAISVRLPDPQIIDFARLSRGTPGAFDK